jgi:hypothetical protein
VQTGSFKKDFGSGCSEACRSETKNRSIECPKAAKAHITPFSPLLVFLHCTQPKMHHKMTTRVNTTAENPEKQILTMARATNFRPN